MKCGNAEFLFAVFVCGPSLGRSLQACFRENEKATTKGQNRFRIFHTRQSSDMQSPVGNLSSATTPSMLGKDLFVYPSHWRHHCFLPYYFPGMPPNPRRISNEFLSAIQTAEFPRIFPNSPKIP